MVTNAAQEHCHGRSVSMLMLASATNLQKMITVEDFCCHFTWILFKIAARDAIVTLKLCT